MKKIALIVAVILFLFMFLTVRMEAQDAAEDLAMAKVLSARYYDFLQMAKVDGKWKIVNVLWVMNPAALRRR